MRASMIVNPILDWKDRDIWEFYNTECGERNPLYDMGYYRVGCIGCPMAVKSREKEFADFPTYRRAYIRAFDKSWMPSTQRKDDDLENGRRCFSLVDGE